jgi:hypothetical protein
VDWCDAHRAVTSRLRATQLRFDLMREGGIDALAAALMRLEAEKNARLRQAAAAYGRCGRSKRP